MKQILLSIFVFSLLAVAQQTRQERIVICTDAGASDAYACTPTPAVTSYTTGLRVRLYPNTANTGAATVNLSALGAKTIVKVGGGITTALADNDIRAGQYVDLVYDGTNFQMLSQLGNVAAGGGSGAAILVSAWETSGMAQNLVRYTAPGFDQGNAAEAVRQFRVLRAGTLSDLGVKTIGTAIASGQTLGAMVRINGADTSITCTITGTANYCEDLTNSAAVAAGDLIDVRYTTSATTGTIFPAFQLQYVPTT